MASQQQQLSASKHAGNRQKRSELVTCGLLHLSDDLLGSIIALLNFEMKLKVLPLINKRFCCLMSNPVRHDTYGRVKMPLRRVSDDNHLVSWALQRAAGIEKLSLEGVQGEGDDESDRSLSLFVFLSALEQAHGGAPVPVALKAHICFEPEFWTPITTGLLSRSLVSLKLSLKLTNSTFDVNRGDLAHLVGLEGLESMELTLVEFQDVGMVPPFPAGAYCLTKLRSLSLSRCFKGCLEALLPPDSLPLQLTSLFIDTETPVMHLRHCVSQLTNLANLCVSEADCRSLPPLSSLQALTCLNLPQNRLTSAAVVAALSGVTGLRYLNLWGFVDMDSALLAEIRKLTCLEWLELSAVQWDVESSCQLGQLLRHMRAVNSKLQISF